MEKQVRGFAAMDSAKHKAIASAGGRRAHELGTAHKWTSEEAREAGRKGGEESARRREAANEADDDRVFTADDIRD